MNRSISLLRWLIQHRPTTTLLAVGAIMLIGALDRVTGFELRMTPLYLLPIAAMAWIGGWRAAAPLIALATLLWWLLFHAQHPYSNDLFFYWEGIIMAGVALVVAWLIARLRASLDRSDERFHRVLEELQAAVYAIDPDNGQVIYANEMLSTLINANPRRLDAAAINRLIGLPAKTNLPAAPGPARFSSREARSQVSGRWFLVKQGPIPWKDHNTVHLHVVTDITAQKQADAMRRQHQEILHRTARQTELAEMASSLAHELNQPLMAIASYSDASLRLLERADLDREAINWALQRSREQARRASQIIARVRSFVQSQRPNPGQFDMTELAKETLDHLQAQLEDHAVTTELALPAGPLPVHADRTLIVQVLLNLLQNAIDTMHDTVPEQRQLRLAMSRNKDGEVLVAVSDHGPGLPPEIAEQAYAPLFTTKTKGLGLGLSICRSIVEAHGGRLWHENHPAGGCTFRFSLPPEEEA